MQDNATLSADLDSKLTPIQERAIVALLSHANTRTAAKAVGVDEATLWRWLQDKDFHTAYMTARRETVKHALARLQQISSEAVNTLREVMRDKTAKGSERVSAAKAIIEYSIKAVEIEDLAQRVEELESVMAATAKPQVMK
jgi:lambda repressor-like predicted transcriptional regulator